MDKHIIIHKQASGTRGITYLTLVYDEQPVCATDSRESVRAGHSAFPSDIRLDDGEDEPLIGCCPLLVKSLQGLKMRRDVVQQFFRVFLFH